MRNTDGVSLSVPRCGLSRLVKAAVLGMLLALACPTVAAAETVRDVLTHLREHGVDTPRAALARMGQASEIPGPAASQDERRRYHGTLASLYVQVDDKEGIEREVGRLQAMADGEGCQPCRIQVLLVRVSSALRRQNADEAKLLMQQVDALALPEAPDLLISMHLARGIAADITGDHDRAIQEAVAAGKLAAQHDYPAEQVRAINLIMLANFGLGDIERAEKAAADAFELAERIGYKSFMVNLRSNQGLIHDSRQEYDKMLVALNDALDIASSSPGLDESRAVILGNLAQYHLNRDQLPDAVRRARESIALGERIGHLRAAGLARMTLGVAQARMGDVPGAIATLQRADADFEKQNSIGDRVAATTNMMRVYREAGRYREALDAMLKAAELKDTLSSAERQKAAVLAQEQFSAARKDYEIQRLSLENARRAAEVSARSWQQRLWAALAVAMALAAVLLFQGMKLARRRNQQLEASNASLSEQSSHDPLTGVFNRRHCQALMTQRERLRLGGPDEDAHGTGLILLDIDFFKHVNDSYGHTAGDVVLVQTAARLRALVRQQDAVVRWGGEEFLLILPGTKAEGLCVLAERVLQVMGGEPFELGGQLVQVTASLGAIAHPFAPGQGWDDALQVADLALYLSKSGGRNRATCLLSVSPEASMDRLRSDLAAAQSAGDVNLRQIIGPALRPGHIRAEPAHG